jgi:hypothetical protein
MLQISKYSLFDIQTDFKKVVQCQDARRTNRLIGAQESVEAAKPELESYANMKTNGHK